MWVAKRFLLFSIPTIISFKSPVIGIMRKLKHSRELGLPVFVGVLHVLYPHGVVSIPGFHCKSFCVGIDIYLGGRRQALKIKKISY